MTNDLGTVTAAASGGEDTTEAMTVQGDDKVLGYFNGDGNSSNLDIVPQVRHETGGTWHDYNDEEKTGQDLTGNSDNAGALRFNVEAAQYQLRFKAVNNADAETSLDVKVGESKDRG